MKGNIGVFVFFSPQNGESAWHMRTYSLFWLLFWQGSSSMLLLLTMCFNGIPSLWILGRPYICGCLLQCCVNCLYFIRGMRSLFLLRICDSFLSSFRVESFFTWQYPPLPIKSACLLEYSTLSITIVALLLSAGRIMIFFFFVFHHPEVIW